jgi:hypothetical protein
MQTIPETKPLVVGFAEPTVAEPTVEVTPRDVADPVPPVSTPRAPRSEPARSGLFAKLALVVGVVVLLVAALWTPIAVPSLVKFPTSTNVHLVYSGTFVTYVNPKTGAALASPAVVPLTINRHIQALPAESTSSVAVVQETMAIRMGTSNLSEVNVYAINRRTMQNVASSKAYTFVPGNVPSRGSSYYVTLPMGLSSSAALALWKPEAATTYLIHPVAGGTAAMPSSLNGDSVQWFTGTLAMTPAPAYESAALASRGLPTSLTPAEVDAQLGAAGVSVSHLTTALLPVLTKAEIGTLAAVLTKPVALQYFIFGSGQLAAEPRTGTIVKLQSIIDGVAVRPNPAPLKTVSSILARHLNVAGVSAAIAAINHIVSAPPQPVYELRYTETPSAVASSVKLANNQAGQISVATLYIPIGLGILGLLLVSPAIVGFARRRRVVGSSAAA